LTPISQGKVMNSEAENSENSENLSTAEQKMAYVLGYDVDRPTLVEKLIIRWRVFMAFRHIRANKIPLQVILRTMNDNEEVKS
jgi:hypothetical protein